MRVRTDISQTWKMLERAQDFTVALQTPQVCSSQFRYFGGIVTEGTQVELGVEDIGDIDHRSQIQVNTIG